MPRAAQQYPKTAVRDPKKTKRAKQRAARYTRRAEQASTPAERHRHAADYLLAAVANSRSPERVARRLADTYERDLHELVSAAGLAGKSAEAHRRVSTRQPRPRLGFVLRLLHAAAEHHAAAGEVHEHYAGELTRQARRVDAAHINRRSGERR